MILPWYYAPGYLAALAFTVGAAASNRRYALTASVLFVDWLACTLITGWVQPAYQLPGIAIVDCLAAKFLLEQHKRMEAVLALSFAAEILLHATMEIRGLMRCPVGVADVRYWWSTFSIACGQVIVLVAWGLNDGGGKFGGRRRAGDDRGLRLLGALGCEARPGDILPARRAGGGR